MLRDSVVVALRHGAVFVLALVVLSAVVLANAVLIERCVMAPACLPTSLFASIASNLDAIIWGANRAANWLISGFAIFCILRSGRGDRVENNGARLRGLGRCILYLASISVSVIAIDAIYRFLAPAVYSAARAGTWIAFVTAVGIIQVSLWAYVDARFAPYVAGLVSAGRREGFRESWRKLEGNRGRVFLLFSVLEGTTALVRLALPDWLRAAMDLMLRVANFEHLAGVPRGSLVQRTPDLTEFVIYASASNALCAAAMLVVHRKMLAISPETRAAVFD
jgi:hypothetical protein